MIEGALKARGLKTYAQYAEHTGASVGALHRWLKEGGTPSPRWIKKLSKKLTIDLEQLAAVVFAEKLKKAS